MSSFNHENEDAHATLLSLVRQALDQDEALRQKYEIGDKFRFIQEKLRELLHHLEEQLGNKVLDIKISTKVLPEGFLPIYVYLFNAQGILLRNWLNMLTPKVFYEYSVNRPIYKDKSAVLDLLKPKLNKAQHGFLTIGIHPQDIIGDDPLTKQIKIKEGSLKFENLLTFTHKEQEYFLNEHGEFEAVLK